MANDMKEALTEDWSPTPASRETQDKTVDSYLSHELVGEREGVHIPGRIASCYCPLREKLNNMEEN